jgi:hypothetical protein
MRRRADLEHVAHAERASQHHEENRVEGVHVNHHRAPILRHCNFELRHELGDLVQSKLPVPRGAGLVHAPIRRRLIKGRSMINEQRLIKG